jgi:hypothetical protein
MQTWRTDRPVEIPSAACTASAADGPDAAGHNRWMSCDRAIVLAAFLIATTGFLASEKIGINDGIGWDGMIYAGWVRDLPKSIDKGIDSYCIQRIFSRRRGPLCAAPLQELHQG